MTDGTFTGDGNRDLRSPSNCAAYLGELDAEIVRADTEQVGCRPFLEETSAQAH